MPLFPAKPSTPTFPLGRAPFACLQCGALANPFCRVCVYITGVSVVVLLLPLLFLLRSPLCVHLVH